MFLVMESLKTLNYWRLSISGISAGMAGRQQERGNGLKTIRAKRPLAGIARLCRRGLWRSFSAPAPHALISYLLVYAGVLSFWQLRSSLYDVLRSLSARQTLNFLLTRLRCAGRLLDGLREFLAFLTYIPFHRFSNESREQEPFDMGVPFQNPKVLRGDSQKYLHPFP